MSIDKDQNIILQGTFSGKTMSIDNFTIQNSSNLITFEIYYNDIFFAKLDKDGKTIWLKSFKGKGDEYSGVKISIDHEDNIYLNGVFDSDTIYFSKMKYEIKNKLNPLKQLVLQYDENVKMIVMEAAEVLGKEN